MAPTAKPLLSKETRQMILANRDYQLEAGSAIESDSDDDSSDWEDSMEESGKSSVDETFFKSVNFKANLVSRPSLITLMLAENERLKVLGNQASHSSAIVRTRADPGAPALGASPNDSDEGPLMMKGMRPSNLKPIIEVPRSNAQPIVAPIRHVHAQVALSPRTTRRSMIAHELIDTLRENLLLERKHNKPTANAVCKRDHTPTDVVNLTQFPERPCLKKSEDASASSWKKFFQENAFDSVHSQCW